jgi:hypothetical protein
LDLTPQRQLFAESLGLAQQLLGDTLVVPEAGLASACVQLG